MQEPNESQGCLLYFLLSELITLLWCTSNTWQVFTHLSIYTWITQYFFLNAHVPSLHQNHFGVITRLIFMDRLGKQTNSLWSHSRTKGKGLHLFAMSLGLQRHPLFACLYNFFSFSYVLYCCNSYTWPSLYLPNRNVHWGTQENKGRQLSPARHAAAKTHSCSRADCQLTGEAGWGTKVTI